MHSSTPTYVECLIGVWDERDEDREDHIDEQRNEDIEVDLGENPGSIRWIRHHDIGVVHVITIDKGEETLRGDARSSELYG